MRIVLDLQACQTGSSRQRGIGRYSWALATAMLKRGAGHEFLVMLNERLPDSADTIRNDLQGLIAPDRVVTWRSPWPTAAEHAEGRSNRGRAEAHRQAFIAALDPDFVHVASLFEGWADDAVAAVPDSAEAAPVAVTLYDLIPLVHRDVYLRHPVPRDFYYERLDELRRARLLLAISDASRREAIELLDLSPERVVNISTAANNIFRREAMEARREAQLGARYGLTRPFVMYTGGIDHRKNIEGLIRAFAKLPAELRGKHQLAVVCRVSDADRERLVGLARQAGLRDGDLVLTGFVSDEDLVALYNLCKLFVFPSWHEGFGLPALEAMACGAPVIASNTSSLPEVVGRSDALFDPHDEEAMAGLMSRVLEDAGFRRSLSERGLERAKQFSWDESARRALEAMEAVHAAHGVPPVHDSSGRKPRLAYVSPLPPERTGIADYGAELLPELTRHYEIEVVSDQAEIGACVPLGCQWRSSEWFDRHAAHYDRVLYQVGNSSFHGHMFDLLSRHPGTAVLHDFYLGHISAHVAASGSDSGFWTRALYESHGYRALLAQCDGAAPGEVARKYPSNWNVLRDSDGVIVHSGFCKRLAASWYGEAATARMLHIPLLRSKRNPCSREEARRALGISDAGFVVASFGVVNPPKLCDRLVSAWGLSRLAKAHGGLLVFVGDSHDNAFTASLLGQARERGIEEQVRITGYVDAAIYDLYLAAADVVVQLRASSRGETSAAILDGFASGRAVIANAHGSAAELPADAVCMISDEFEDRELAAALESLSDDMARREALGRAGRAYLEQMHDPARIAARYRAAIENFHATSSHRRMHRVAQELIARTTGTVAQPGDIEHAAQALAEVVPQDVSQRQLLVDVSQLSTTDAHSGIQRVVRSIVLELLRFPPEGFRVEPVYAVYGEGGAGYRYARAFTSRFLGIGAAPKSDSRVDVSDGDVFLGLDLAPHIVPGCERALLRMRRQGVRIHFVLYDMLAALHPEWFPEDLVGWLDQWRRSVARVSNSVVAISRAVAGEFSHWLERARPARSEPLEIAWFHLGSDIESSKPTTGTRAETARALARWRKRRVFLMVGTVEARKGYAQALDAFEMLWSQGSQACLAIVGKPGWHTEALVGRLRGHPESGRRLFWFEALSDEALGSVYAASSVLLAASFGEGFGLPLIEAARHRIPVLARNLPVFHEVAGEAVVYFDAANATELVRAISDWEIRAQQGRLPDVPTPTPLTWRQSTHQLLDVIKLDGRSATPGPDVCEDRTSGFHA
ncbi:MAG: hypothetical protein BGP23_04730 [Lysobacterales bacterium 66-474]|nr:MAG: hypothetical protein BGP23_04730 [Xanthomonadales bacterium 66-474]